jgi:phage terminase Nu1 subunit (DNA packaging protein)
MGSAAVAVGDPGTVAGAAAPDEITRERVGEISGDLGPDPGADPPRLLVNKRELRRVLDVSLPTLNDMIDHYPEFPVVTRGALGQEWQFDPVAVTSWRAAQTAADNAASAARAAQLQRQFALPIDEISGEEIGESLSQRLKRNQVRAIEQKLARDLGETMLRGAVEQAATAVCSKVGNALNGIARTVGHAHNLPDQVTTALQQSIDEIRAQMVADILDWLAQDGEGGLEL